MSLLKKERDELRTRERLARTEAETAQRRLSQFVAASKRFTSSMRGLSSERQRSGKRLSVQYAVGRVLADSENLKDAAPGILQAIGEGLGWEVGAVWMVDEGAGVLRCLEVWRTPGSSPDVRAFESATRRIRFPRGLGLPGRVWATGQAVQIADVLGEEGLFREASTAAAGLSRAFAFPIRDGGQPLGVVEFFGSGQDPPEEHPEDGLDGDLLRTATLIGHQIGQFVERRLAEAEWERLLAREREARVEAERSRRQVTDTLESISDAFFSLDWERRFSYANQEAERLWSKERDEMLGRKVLEVFPEAVGSESYRAIERAVKEQVTVRFEEFSPVNGHWISGTAYPSASGVSVYFRDVTERREAEQALRQREERFRSLIQHASDIITVLEADGTISYESPSVERILGHTPEEMVGKNALEYVHPDDAERVLEAGAGALESGGISPLVEFRFRHRDGSWRYLESIGTNLLNDATVRGIVVNSRDITERRLAESERDRSLRREREARDAADAAQERLAYLAGASEERRSISRELHDRVAHSMAVVHQSLELYEVLKDQDAGKAESKMTLARRLTKNALNSTRDLSLALRESEVEEGLGPALSKLLGTTVPPEVRYAVSVEGEEALVPPYARDQLFLILREAVRNAAAHSAGNQIIVELDISPQRIVGRVEDDGRGFDPAEARGNGTGGLRSMRERSSLLGGALNLKSGPKAGTKVEVVVPLGEPEKAGNDR